MMNGGLVVWGKVLSNQPPNPNSKKIKIEPRCSIAFNCREIWVVQLS
jgi:hypothetical protein